MNSVPIIQMNINNTSENNSETRLKHLEKENNDLIETNKNLEQRLKQLETYITLNGNQINKAMALNKGAKTPISLNKNHRANKIKKLKKSKTSTVSNNNNNSLKQKAKQVKKKF